ncbi:GGDEF domain-containing protein [Fusibacter ferrireducens]|uniref:GGDEF domain-containing protein n=1 Tax=Fusibacter ferrireducens TaxID=2785058 RepID=A0ABR9ZXU0_9FIRM|nr:GGDEF domain-containing protein [Fusibacter ferrireducens]MBF4694968.1 GGDEF domain-containing protein [Fusibacter ferrireducens]
MEKLTQNQRIHAIVFQENLDRILKIGGIFTIVEIIDLILSLMGVFHDDIKVYILIVLAIHFVLLPIIYYQKKLYYVHIRLNAILEKVYFVSVMTWGTAFTVLNQIKQGNLTTFALVLVVLSMVVTMRSEYTTLLMGLNNVIFLSIGNLLYEETYFTTDIMFTSIMYTVIAISLSRQFDKQRFEIKRNHIMLQEQNEKLENLAIRDSMTQLYNNAYIHDFIDKSIKYCNTQKGPLCILILDIDDFKQINDTYGHLFGDEVIKSIASMLKYRSREGDIVGRYGGEEFMIVMPHIHNDITAKIADRFRVGVEELVFSKDVKVTVSIGGACLEEHTAMELIELADKNLYEAKRRGKNRVVIS